MDDSKFLGWTTDERRYLTVDLKWFVFDPAMMVAKETKYPYIFRVFAKDPLNCKLCGGRWHHATHCPEVIRIVRYEVPENFEPFID